jgi:hypothetical protein
MAKLHLKIQISEITGEELDELRKEPNPYVYVISVMDGGEERRRLTRRNGV